MTATELVIINFKYLRKSEDTQNNVYVVCSRNVLKYNIKLPLL